MGSSVEGNLFQAGDKGDRKLLLISLPYLLIFLVNHIGLPAVEAKKSINRTMQAFSQVQYKNRASSDISPASAGR